MAPSFWKRYRKALIAAAAVGSAAGAAAGAYYWWSSEQQRRNEQPDGWDAVLDALTSIMDGERKRRRPGSFLDQDTEGPGAALGSGIDSTVLLRGAPGQGAASAAASVLDQTLQQHFDSIQELSDKQALEDLLPRLKGVLIHATDFDTVKDSIKNMSSDDGPAAAEKLALWRQLARLCFTRAMAACWLVPLLDLLVRLKLHIVGRHLYLESRLPELQPRGAAGGGGARGGGGFGQAGRMQMPPRLSERAKEEFFRSDYFIAVGAIGIIHKMALAVDRVLANVDFNTLMGPADVERLVIDMHAHFEAGFERFEDLWHQYLLPPGQQPISVRTASGMEAFMSPIEAAMVDELNGELRDATADYRFLEALRAAVRHTSRITGAYVTSKYGPSSSRSADRLAEQMPDSPTAATGAAAGTSATPEHSSGGHDSTRGHSHAHSPQRHGSHSHRRTGSIGAGGPSSGGAGTSSGGAAGASSSGLHPGGSISPKPFAFIVPLVAKSCLLLFDEANRCTKRLRDGNVVVLELMQQQPQIQPLPPPPPPPEPNGRQHQQGQGRQVQQQGPGQQRQVEEQQRAPKRVR